MSVPVEPDWQRLVITVRKDAVGDLVGVLSIGATVWNLRGWNKAGGVLLAEVQPTDWAHEETLRMLEGRADG